MKYGEAFSAWRERSKSWHAYVTHDFVEGLRRGDLPRSAFLHYLRQDYVFLVHFSRAWALAVAKAETLEEMKTASATVNALVNEEMRLHVQTCAAEGISEEELFATVEAQENLAYTRYVLEAGYSGDFLDLMATLAPCVMGYGEIGVRLLPEVDGNQYADWIQVYGGQEYQELCENVGSLIDAAMARRIGADYMNSPRWVDLSEKFETATSLEVGFWRMGFRGE